MAGENRRVGVDVYFVLLTLEQNQEDFQHKHGEHKGRAEANEQKYNYKRLEVGRRITSEESPNQINNSAPERQLLIGGFYEPSTYGAATHGFAYLGAEEPLLPSSCGGLYSRLFILWGLNSGGAGGRGGGKMAT
jgi:hypothetical protein